MTHEPRALLSEGRKAIGSLRARAEDVAERGLATTTAAAEFAGHRVADAVSRGSKEVSKVVKHYAPQRSTGFASIPAVRTVARFARRHPAALFALGAGTAALGYLAWRSNIRRHDKIEENEA
jgi:hypothetical protein